MSEIPPILVVGSHAPGIFLRVKRVPRAGETVIGWDFQEPVDGGKGSNQAIAAARLGGRVSFVGCVGRDRIGEDGERWMREAGVDTRFLRRSETTASGVGFIILDENGIPAMVTSMGANAEIRREDIATAIGAMQGSGVLLTQFEIDPPTALYAAQLARQAGMTAIVNPAPAPEFPVAGLEAATILTPNETEAKVLLGLEPDAVIDPAELAATLREKSRVEQLIITVGKDGAVGTDRAGIWKVAPPEVEVVDTSGAGDVFCAALAVGLVEGKPLKVAAEWACGAAALSVSKPGTIPAYPTRAEVDLFLRSRKPNVMNVR
ncbi:MAG TPA: ribokinase [Aggregatilineales bacterium]|nr:ribokinase [Aggregatilineales bacterium]